MKKKQKRIFMHNFNTINVIKKKIHKLCDAD